MTFLKNIWYVAGHAEDISSTPFARTILDEPIVFFRTAEGKPVDWIIGVRIVWRPSTKAKSSTMSFNVPITGCALTPLASASPHPVAMKRRRAHV
jgi:hypothetical protein